MSRWENGKIITEANPVAEGKGKAQKFVREISNDELIQVIYLSVMFIILSHDYGKLKTNKHQSVVHVYNVFFKKCITKYFIPNITDDDF